MARPRVYKTEAIVLKRVNLGEADSIVTLYTPNLGKLRAVAKGVRRPKSKLCGHLELLTRSSLLLAQGQNLDIVTQCQSIEGFAQIKSDLKRIGCALYMAELLEQFTVERAENYAAYRLLNDDLLWLCNARNPNAVLRHFELQLLAHLGYQPELYDCVHCRTPLQRERNMFSNSEGGVLCPTCAGTGAVVRPVSVDGLKVLRFLLGNDGAAAERLRIEGDLSREVGALTRSYIRYILEREMRSLEFLDHLEAGEPGVDHGRLEGS
jgi:DNA repair protein RecO (recombination protein O)